MKLSSLLVAIISSSSIMVLEGRDGGGTRNLAKEKPSKPKQKKDKKKKDKKKKDKKKKDKKKKDKKKKDKKKKDKKKDDYEKSEDYLACVEDCTLYEERCEKQCKSLEDCTSTIKNKVKKHESEWSDLLDGSVDEWVSKLKEFIANAKYGMMFSNQNDFCTGLEEWIGDFDGKLGSCVLYKNHPSLKKSSAPSYDSVCGNIDGGASDTERKLQDDDSTCNIASDPMQSPTTCFEPDPYVYYNFRATFQEDTSGELPYGDFGYLSQNYEYMEEKNPIYEGQSSQQMFRYGSFCSETQYHYNNNGQGGGYAPGPEFLIGGNILQSTNTPLVTNAMWRFDEADPDAGEGFYKISNRRTGNFINVDYPMLGYQQSCYMEQQMPTPPGEYLVYFATADTKTNGCSLCKGTSQSAPDGYSLSCIDRSSDAVKFYNNKWPEKYPDGIGCGNGVCFPNEMTWMNFNLTLTSDSKYDGSTFENNFCIDNVTNYQRADVYSPGAVTYTPAASSGSSTVKYIKGGLAIGASLMGLEIPAGVSALVKITGAVTNLGGSDDSQVEAINALVSDISETGITMARSLSSQNKVNTCTAELNSERNQFMCDYAGSLINAMNSVDPTELLFCNNQLSTLKNLKLNAYSYGFVPLVPTPSSCYTSPSSETCKQPVENARYGWDILQVASVDITHYMQELMFLYAYVYAKYNTGSVCGYTPPSTSPTTICENIDLQFLQISSMQSAFTTAFTQIPSMLGPVRMNSTTLNGNANGENLAPGGTGPDSQHANYVNYTTDYSNGPVEIIYTGGGYNYQQYQWSDQYFSPAKQQAYWYSSTGYGGNPDIDIPYKDILQMYYEEISWDMEHWSYNTTVDVNGTSTMIGDAFGDAYKQALYGICEMVLENPDEAMANHITQLTNVTDRCNNANEITGET